MTKYVINSGASMSSSDKGKGFFHEIVKGLGSSPNIVFCFFAERRENWENKFSVYKTGFSQALDNKKIEPVFVMANPVEFAEQVKQADAIILYGGDDHLLLYWLRQFDAPSFWEVKVIASISAGSDALASSFWTCDWRQCFDGLNILPIKFIPHFGSEYGSNDPRGPIDWEKAKSELEKYGDTSLPVYALSEGDYVVFEV